MRTRRVITKLDGWGVYASWVGSKDVPGFPSIYVGGCQTGYGRVWVCKSYLRWEGVIGLIADGHGPYILTRHQVFRAPKRFIRETFGMPSHDFTYLPLSRIPKQIYPSGVVIPGSHTLLDPPQNWKELYSLAALGRKMGDGAILLDWLMDNGPPIVQRLLQDADFGRQHGSVEEAEKMFQPLPNVAGDQGN